MMVAAGRTRAQCAKLSARAFEASSTRTSANSTATTCHFFAQIGTQANIVTNYVNANFQRNCARSSSYRAGRVHSASPPGPIWAGV